MEAAKTIETALRTALTEHSSNAQAFVAQYAYYATESNVQRYDVVWDETEGWTVDGMSVKEWVELMTDEEVAP
jgi:hypothetical protein